MNKNFLLLLCAVLFLGCSTNSTLDMKTNTAMPVINTASETPSITLVPTLAPTQTPAETATPFPILSPEEREKLIAELIRTNGDCSTPCFWGISPYISDYNNSVLFLKSLGHKGLEKTEDSTRYYNVSYSFKDETSVINIVLHGKNDKVEGIEAIVEGLNNENISSLDWSALRPDMIIKSYGTPSNIFVGFREGPDGRISYKLLFSYDVSKLSIMYDPIDAGTLPANTLHTCPLKERNIRRLSIWLGETSVGFLDGMISIEKTSLLSLEEFSKLLATEPDTWCLDLNLNN